MHMIDYTKQIEEYLMVEREVLSNIKAEEISNVMNILEKARMYEKRVFICGNGGSASTASHFVCDFNKGVSMELEKKYDFECLSDNVPMMMAIANDISYDDIFAIPLKNKLAAGDVVIGISGSGNSENVRRALEYGKQMGAITVALTGYDGGVIKKTADHCIHINVNHMQIVEDVHLILDHMMMYILSKANAC